MQVTIRRRGCTQRQEGAGSEGERPRGGSLVKVIAGSADFTSTSPVTPYLSHLGDCRVHGRLSWGGPRLCKAWGSVHICSQCWGECLGAGVNVWGAGVNVWGGWGKRLGGCSKRLGGCGVYWGS